MGPVAVVVAGQVAAEPVPPDLEGRFVARHEDDLPLRAHALGEDPVGPDQGVVDAEGSGPCCRPGPQLIASVLSTEDNEGDDHNHGGEHPAPEGDASPSHIRHRHLTVPPWWLDQPNHQSTRSAQR